MENHELTRLTPSLVEKLRTHSEDDAPWAGLHPLAPDFLLAGINNGLDWRIHNDVLEAYLKPSTKAAAKRQAQARDTLRSSHEATNAFPSGIGLREEYHSGHWSETDEDGDEAPSRRFTSLSENLPGKERLFSRLMEVFWPDAPPLVWAQVCDHLVQRHKEERRWFYDGTDEYLVDHLDFGRALRFLSHAERLAPQARTNWEAVINPPAPPTTVSVAKKPRRSK